MKVRLHKRFHKYFKKLPVKVQNKFAERLSQFVENPFHPILGNHAVDAAYPGWRSINITGDYRALFEIQADGVALFMKIGTHAELYR